MTVKPSHQLERIHFPRGTKIFHEGEPGSFAYLIEKGKIEISSLNHGQKIVISTLGAGDLFGEMALIDNMKRSASAAALDDTDVIALGRSQFEGKISSADPMLHMLLRVVLKRFRWALRKVLVKERMGMTGELTNAGQAEVFNSAREEAIRQIRTERDLHEALRLGQFELHYQPIVAASDQRLAGFEALIRWRHPEQGLLMPTEFIGAAEDSQLIVPIGDWVFAQACDDLARIQSATLPDNQDLFMAVNVSAKQVEHLAGKDRLSDIMESAGVSPQNLKLEFTESVLIQSPELAFQALGEIRKSGVSLAIDDFGTGYSSLSYLHRFPLDVLKIDRSFVSDLSTNSQSLGIVRAIIGLARELSMKVVAEGIETRDALQALVELECDFIQGFLFSHALPVEQAIALVASGSHYDHSQQMGRGRFELADGRVKPDEQANLID